jgi:hypothetical protein
LDWAEHAIANAYAATTATARGDRVANTLPTELRMGVGLAKLRAAVSPSRLALVRRWARGPECRARRLPRAKLLIAGNERCSRHDRRTRSARHRHAIPALRIRLSHDSRSCPCSSPCPRVLGRGLLASRCGRRTTHRSELPKGSGATRDHCAWHRSGSSDTRQQVDRRHNAQPSASCRTSTACSFAPAQPRIRRGPSFGCGVARTHVPPATVAIVRYGARLPPP